jgi:hypothetical protein
MRANPDPVASLISDGVRLAKWSHRTIGRRHPRRFAAMVGATIWAILSIATYHLYPGMVFGAVRIALGVIAGLLYLRRNPAPKREREPELSEELLAVKDALIDSAHERATVLHSDAAGMMTKALASGPLSETAGRFLHMHLGHVTAARQEAADLLRLSTLIGSDSDATAALLATAMVTAHLDEITSATAQPQPADDAAEADDGEAREVRRTHGRIPADFREPPAPTTLDQLLGHPLSGAHRMSGE